MTEEFSIDWDWDELRTMLETYCSESADQEDLEGTEGLEEIITWLEDNVKNEIRENCADCAEELGISEEEEEPEEAEEEEEA